MTKKLRIPTIGIGAGNACDGQVLVYHDLVGMSDGPLPKFVKSYANIRTQIVQAVSDFRDEVRSGQFPDRAHSYG